MRSWSNRNSGFALFGSRILFQEALEKTGGRLRRKSKTGFCKNLPRIACPEINPPFHLKTQN